MNIAIIGSGNIGGRLAASFAKVGHQVTIGSRSLHKDSLKQLVDKYPNHINIKKVNQAADGNEVIVMAVPANFAFEIASELGDVSNKLIIDAMNAIFRPTEQFTTTSEAIITATGCSRIVKCFNSIGAENIDKPNYGEDKAAMLYCGNSVEDKKIVNDLCAQIGFDPYDLGGLENEPHLEQLAKLWSLLAFGESNLGRNIAFKILKQSPVA